LFGKSKSIVTFPAKAVFKGGKAAGGKVIDMKRWFTSKTIGTALMFLFAKLFGSLMVDVEVLTLIEQYAAWSLPLLMILLRIVTKGPITK